MPNPNADAETNQTKKYQTPTPKTKPDFANLPNPNAMLKQTRQKNNTDAQNQT